VQCTYYSNYVFTDASGASHNLPLGWLIAENQDNYVTDIKYNGECDVSPMFFPQGVGNIAGVVPQGGDAEITAAINGASNGNGVDAESVNVYDSNGTTYQFLLGSASGYPPTQIEDRNGNLILPTGSPSANYQLGYKDTLGRWTLSIAGTGTSGSTDIVTVGGTNPIYLAGGLQYKVQWGSVNSSYTPSMHAIPPPVTLVGGQACSGIPTTNGGTQNVITAIILPNNQQYSFYYGSNTLHGVSNPYGLLNEIDYPDGGWVTYAWTTTLINNTSNPASSYSELGTFSTWASPSGDEQEGPKNAPMPNMCQYLYTPPVVSTRTVSFDGTNVALIQTFGLSTNWPAYSTSNSPAQLDWSSKTTTVKTTDNIANESYTATYNYTPYSLAQTPYSTQAIAAQLPLEQSVTTSDWNGNVLNTETKGWYNQFQMACDFNTLNGMSGLTSGHFYKYFSGQVSDDKEYDFGSQGATASAACTGPSPSAPSITPARETVTSFQSFPIAGSAAGLPVGSPPVFPPQMYARPQSVVVYGKGAKVAETDYWYDQTAVSAAVSGGAQVSVVNHDDQLYPAGTNPASGRGNVTTITKNCLGTCPANPVTTMKYDVAGQVTSVTDPRGNTTSYDYTDQFTDTGSAVATDAYLTTVTSPPVGVGGARQHHYYKYRYSDGQLSSSQDDNDVSAGVATTYQYSDPLNRLTQTTYPDQGMTYVCYVDSSSSPSITTSKLLNTPGSLPACPLVTPLSNWVSNTSIMDGIGHVVRTELFSDPAGADITDITYYGTGQVHTKTNPYRSSPNGTTTYSYDALGRMVYQLDADAVSTQWWCYNGTPSLPVQPKSNCNSHLVTLTGSWVDSQDENGNDWQRTSNGLGQLIEVMEPNGISPSPSMETDYGYDTLNNLLSVNQWGGPTNSPGYRMRTFSYDSLSRPQSATNPETGTVNYVYDPNGNVQSKTDARGVISAYQYDSMNRLFCTSYSSDVSGTPSSWFEYGTTAGFVGRLKNEWTRSYSAGACPATPVTAPSTGFLTKRSILAYDLMGRALNEQQYTLASQANGASYSPVYTYDLAGNLTSSTTGFGPTSTSPPITLSYTYDGAGRLRTVSNLATTVINGITMPTLLFAPPATTTNLPCVNSPNSQIAVSSQYTAFGALANAALGSDLTLNRAFDSRLRTTCEIDQGTGATPATPGSATVTITGSEQSQ
jgi:YD repeat-containing protein